MPDRGHDRYLVKSLVHAATLPRTWVVFTGQFAPGQRHVYAVAIEK